MMTLSLRQKNESASQGVNGMTEGDEEAFGAILAPHRGFKRSRKLTSRFHAIWTSRLQFEPPVFNTSPSIMRGACNSNSFGFIGQPSRLDDFIRLLFARRLRLRQLSRLLFLRRTLQIQRQQALKDLFIGQLS